MAIPRDRVPAAPDAGPARAWGRALLAERVTRHPRAAFAAVKHAESWTQPMARFEVAAAFWDERYAVTEGAATVTDQTGAAVDVDTLRQCGKLLDEVAGWGAYELDVRVGPKITTGKDTLKELGI